MPPDFYATFALSSPAANEKTGWLCAPQILPDSASGQKIIGIPFRVRMINKILPTRMLDLPAWYHAFPFLILSDTAPSEVHVAT
jgi:hypothetical protein